MSAVSPETTYPDGTIPEDCDVVTRGKATTLWEVVDTTDPDRVRLSRIGSYGEVQQWVDVADLTFQHRRRFTGGNTCQALLDLQDRVHDAADSVKDGVRYVRRLDSTHEAAADVLARATHRLAAAVTGHTKELETLYGVTQDGGTR